MSIGPTELAFYRCAYSRTTLGMRVDKPRLKKCRVLRAAARLLAHLG